MRGGGGGGGGGREGANAYNLMWGGYRGKLCSRRSSNVVEVFQNCSLDFLQLLSGVAVLHVGNCDAQPMSVIVQIKLLQCLQAKESPCRLCCHTYQICFALHAGIKVKTAVLV